MNHVKNKFVIRVVLQQANVKTHPASNTTVSMYPNLQTKFMNMCLSRDCITIRLVINLIAAFMNPTRVYALRLM